MIICSKAYNLHQNFTIEQVARLVDLITTVEEHGLAAHRSQWLFLAGDNSLYVFITFHFCYCFYVSHNTHSRSGKHICLFVTTKRYRRRRKTLCVRSQMRLNPLCVNTRKHARTHVQACACSRKRHAYH